MAWIEILRTLYTEIAKKPIMKQITLSFIGELVKRTSKKMARI
jgi:hypothetical protein